MFFSFRNPKNEKGSSKLEASAVMGIFVVLSIIGIICYYYVLDEHGADEILNKASQRALVISSQIQNNQKITMEDFKSDQDIFIGIEKLNKSQFKILLSNIDKDICEKMRNLGESKSALQYVAKDCSYLVYNNNFNSQKTPVCEAGNYLKDNKCTPCPIGDITCGCTGNDIYSDGRGGCGHYVENFADKTLTSRLPDVCCKTGFDLAINGECAIENQLY